MASTHGDGAEPSPHPERNETPAERIDRNWAELLQELRVTQTGVQILFAFLLTLPFQSRFDVISGARTFVYVAVVVLVAVSAICNLTPVVVHRLVFARHRKDSLVATSDRLTKTGLVGLGLALIGAVWLIADIVIGRLAAHAMAGGLALLLGWLWIVVPFRLLKRAHEGY